MSNQTILLNGTDWQICKGEAKSNALPLSVPGNTWIDATVPGNIQADIERAKFIKPIWYGPRDDYMTALCLSDWWYRKTFFAKNDWAQKRISLFFGGVDFACEIFINGTPVYKNEGTFKQFWVDISNHVRLAEENELQVKIDAMPPELLEWIVDSDGKMSAEGEEKFFVFANNKIRQTLKGLKSPGNCSYDWGTNIYTLGIWKDVALHVTGTVRADCIQARGLLNSDYSAGTASVTLELDCSDEAEINVDITLTGKEGAKTIAAPFTVTKGKNKVTLDIPVENPNLWWPTGYGEPALYTVDAAVSCGGGISCNAHARFGFRDVQWEPTEGAPAGMKNKFGLVINGQRVRTLGSCFTSPDLLPGRLGSRGTHYLDMAKACNMNTFRQHGAQVIMPAEFYDAADEAGIMILLDFPIGNCMPETDDVFLKKLKETITSIVKETRNHPCILEWSGGNELDIYFNVAADDTGVRVIEAAVLAEDDTRTFRDTCPIEGSRHAPWDYNADLHYDYYNSDLKDNKGIIPLMRYGEFGCQTPSNLEVWQRDFPLDSQWPLDPENPTQYRKNALNAVFDHDYWLRPAVIERFFGPLDNLEMVIKGGQYLGAEGLRYAMDALRAMGKRLGGFSSWDYNEPWPNGAGSFLVDYDGRPVMMYHFVKEALTPVTLQLKYDQVFYSMYRDTFATIRIVSDAPNRQEDLSWTYTGRDREGNVYEHNAGTISINPLEVIELGQIKITPPFKMAAGPVLGELILKDSSGTIIAQRVHLFCAEGAQYPLRSLLTQNKVNNYPFDIPYVTTGLAGREVAKTTLAVQQCRSYEDDIFEYMDVTLQNTGSMTALFIELHPLLCYRTDLIIPDNFISIPPSEERTITIKARKNSVLPLPAPETLPQTGFTVSCFNAPELTIAPDESVLLHMGRRNKLCRGYKGYEEKEGYVTEVTATNGVISTAEVSYISRDKANFSFTTNTQNPATLYLHLADNAKQGCRIRVLLNGSAIAEETLCGGYGVQDAQPDHLACAQTLTIPVAGGSLQNNNRLEVQVLNGWFTWDAMSLIMQ
ncbi:MAG: glycoside hydrolase family 2 protein [Oscillospiraceae bacterium]